MQQSKRDIVFGREEEAEMRLKKENLQGLQMGSQRVKRFFAILPTYTREDGKGRWLERVTVLQEIVPEMNYESMDYGYHKEWKNLQFIDKKVQSYIRNKEDN